MAGTPFLRIAEDIDVLYVGWREAVSGSNMPSRCSRWDDAKVSQDRPDHLRALRRIVGTVSCLIITFKCSAWDGGKPFQDRTETLRALHGVTRSRLRIEHALKVL